MQDVILFLIIRFECRQVDFIFHQYDPEVDLKIEDKQIFSLDLGY